MGRAVAWTLRALLVVLAIAALIGLGVVFTGAEGTVMQVLGSVLVLGAALLLALSAALAPWVPMRAAIAVLASAGAVLTWITIWAPDDGGSAWVGRAAAMIAALLVVVAVALVLRHLTLPARARRARRVAIAGDAAGLVLLGMVWAMIATDGAAGIPDRAIAGTAIIYAASALSALVMAVMRSYAIVRRD
jgi:hypothetical protein